MDLKSIAEAYQSIQEGKVNAGLQAYLDKKKGKKENGEEKEEENGKESKGSKPDFLDLDKDGDKKEPMKKAAKEKKEETEHNYVNAYLEGMGSMLVPKPEAKVRRVITNKTNNNPDSEKVAEHHQKDADGKVIEHENTTPSSVEERASITAHDVNYGTKAGMDFMAGARNAAGELKYKLVPAGGMRIKLANSYEPKKSNWREDFVWTDEVEEAVKRPKLEIQEKGIKNKIEINPDDGIKEEKKN